MGLFDMLLGRRQARREARAAAKAAKAAAAQENEHHDLPPALPVLHPTIKETSSALNSMASTTSLDSNSSAYSEEMDLEINPVNASNNAMGGAMHNYELVKELGRGATAIVQLGRKKDCPDELVAMKVYKTSLLKKMRDVKRVGRRMVVSTALDKVQEEIAIMKKLKHTNLISLLEVFDDDDESLVLMLEYASMGQVMQWNSTQKMYQPNPKLLALFKQSDISLPGFNEDIVRIFARQLLSGLEYLHENNTCHRDLKPENILAGEGGVCKIADFGVAHLFDDEKAQPVSNDNNQATATSSEQKKGYVSSTAGTYAFLGPETLKGGQYCAYAADRWALGVTLYALVYGRIPFYHCDVVELFDLIENEPVQFEHDFLSVSPGLLELLQGLLNKNAEERWTIAHCKRHPWVLEGLSDEERQEFLHEEHEKVVVNEEDIANAVTRVNSLRVMVNVKLSANKWMRRIRQSREKRASIDEKQADPTQDSVEARKSINVSQDQVGDVGYIRESDLDQSSAQIVQVDNQIDA